MGFVLALPPFLKKQDRAQLMKASLRSHSSTDIIVDGRK
jgi:hypothetical protein